MTLDLSDDEIKRALEVCVTVVRKHQDVWKQKYPFTSMEQIADLLNELEKELAYKMMEEVECLVRVDGTPAFVGQPPVIEWLGKVDTSSLAKYGQDHERKTWEVQHAEARGESYLGEKDNYRSQ